MGDPRSGRQLLADAPADAAETAASLRRTADGVRRMDDLAAAFRLRSAGLAGRVAPCAGEGAAVRGPVQPHSDSPQTGGGGFGVSRRPPSPPLPISIAARGFERDRAGPQWPSPPLSPPCPQLWAGRGPFGTGGGPELEGLADEGGRAACEGGAGRAGGDWQLWPADPSPDAYAPGTDPADAWWSAAPYCHIAPRSPGGHPPGYWQGGGAGADSDAGGYPPLEGVQGEADLAADAADADPFHHDWPFWPAPAAPPAPWPELSAGSARPAGGPPPWPGPP